MTGEHLRIGELARAAGVTVRALHHYDSLGLLVPSERTQAGHRLYSPAEVRRLYRLLALRGVGLPLEEIGPLLDREPSTDQFLDAMEAMTMFERYYTPEQLQELERRRSALGEDAIKAVENEWAELFARLRALREAGTDPADPEPQALGRRASELIRMFTGGDPGIASSLQRMYEQEGAQRASRGLADPDDVAYLEAVTAARS